MGGVIVRWMTAMLVACVGTLAAGELRVGTGVSDITPERGVPLDGTISQNGPVKEVHDPLHVRALVFDDGKTKVVLATVDSTMVSSSLIDEAKVLIEEETGIPGRCAIISATHSHSTPRAVVDLVDDEAFEAYLDALPRGIADAVAAADESLRPAAVGKGSLDAPEHVHNRRWFVEESARIANPIGEKGEPVRMNPGGKGLIEPAGPVDPELFLLSVRTREGDPLAVLGNYGLHYVGGTGRGKVSADYFGVFAREMKAALAGGEDFIGLLSNGASGDVNAIDYSRPRKRHAPYENIERIGSDLAERAAPVVESIEHESDLTLAARETVLTLGVRKPDGERLAWAEETAVPPETPLRLNRPQVYAREALRLADFPDEIEVRVQAVRIGDIGVVGIPCEVFAETGLAIKEASPFPAAFVMELANGYHGYLPTPEQHEWGGYETWPARSSYLEVDAETAIREASIDLLRALAE